MGRRLASALVLALALASLNPIPGVAAPPVSQLAETQLVPLILIHGLGGSADAFRAPGGTGLEQRLQQAGYAMGRDLFALDYREDNNGDYVHVASDHLRPLVSRVLEQTGAAQVDLLGYSMGGLVARYYLGLPGESVRVRTLVLLASPSRGSFAANIVKDAQVTQDYLETYAGVPLPPGTEPEEKAALPVSSGMAASVSAPLDYVFTQARATFEPLLVRFLLQSKLGRRAPVLERFADWLDRTEPGRRAELFDTAQAPLSLPDAAIMGSDGADPRRALTRAYLHLLGLNAARVRLQTLLQGSRVTPALGAVESLVGWMAIQPQGVAIERLLSERFRLGTGPEYLGNYFLSAWNGRERDRRREAAVATAALARVDEQPRYVVVAGTVPNVFSLAWPGVKPNDGAVEAASAWLPLGRDDSFHLLRGQGPATSHVGLKLNPTVAGTIVRELDPAGPAAARQVRPLVRRWFWRDLEWEETGSLAISRWSPTYLDITQDRLKGRSGSLTVDLSPQGGLGGTLTGLWHRIRGAAGVSSSQRSSEIPLVWAEFRDDSGTRQVVPVQVTGTGRKWRATLQLPSFGDTQTTLRLGVRLDGNRPELPPADSARVDYRIRFQPRDEAAAPTGAEDTSQGQGSTAQQGAAAAPGPTGDAAGTAGSAGTDGASGSGGLGAPRETGPSPLIVVRRGTKETTHKDPSEERHAQWQWDFGDGTVETDDDPTKLTSEREHAYGAPGQYRVTATSLSNLGRVLRQQIWNVTVGKGVGGDGTTPIGAVGQIATAVGQATRFLSDTLRPPWLRLELEGPAKWMTRRPASYTVKVETLPVPWVVRQKVTVDPARTFRVAWEKPGTYVVRAAVSVETTYLLPEGGTVTLRNTYTVSKQVKVFTPTLSDL